VAVLCFPATGGFPERSLARTMVAGSLRRRDLWSFGFRLRKAFRLRRAYGVTSRRDLMAGRLRPLHGALVRAAISDGHLLVRINTRRQVLFTERITLPRRLRRRQQWIVKMVLLQGARGDREE
jgi:hypothetical protein